MSRDRRTQKRATSQRTTWWVLWTIALIGSCGITSSESQGFEPEHILISGTCVRANGIAPAVGVQITLYPEALQTTSDLDGDFLLAWKGQDSYLEFRVEETGYCAQFALPSQDPTARLDLGLIQTISKRQQRKPPQAELAPGTLPPMNVREQQVPQQQRVPVKPDRSSGVRRVWFGLRIDVDRFGRVQDVALQTGDTPTESLFGAVEEWARSVLWMTPHLTRCAEPAFRTILPMAYTFDPATEIWTRDPNNRPHD